MSTTDHATWTWARGDWPRCATCGDALLAKDVDDADVAQVAHLEKMTATEPDDGPIGEVPPAVLAYETRLDVTRAEIVRLTGERDAAVAEVAHQRKIAARRADIIRDLAAAHDGVVRDLMAIHQVAAEQRTRADAAEARLRAVEALHQPRPNSTSAMYPTPLCSCGEDYPECPTAAALSSDAAPQAVGVTLAQAWVEGMAAGRARWMRDDDNEEYPPVNPYDAAPQAAGVTRGVDLIAAERQRQIDVEGYTAEHDAGHVLDLVRAAICYATPETRRPGPPNFPPVNWPWAPHYWKPTPADRTRELVKAGALMAAAIDALLPVADAPAAPEGER